MASQMSRPPIQYMTTCIHVVAANPFKRKLMSILLGESITVEMGKWEAFSMGAFPFPKQKSKKDAIVYLRE